jgi:hypothetical protein
MADQNYKQTTVKKCMKALFIKYNIPNNKKNIDLCKTILKKWVEISDMAEMAEMAHANSNDPAYSIIELGEVSYNLFNKHEDKQDCSIPDYMVMLDNGVYINPDIITDPSMYMLMGKNK